MRYLILILIALNVACAKHTSYIEPEYEVYVQEFMNDAAAFGIRLDASRLTIVNETMNKEGSVRTLGVCSIDSNNNLRISMNKELFDSKTPELREFVMFHELAHCLVHMPHFDKDIDIMNTYVNNAFPVFINDKKTLKNKVFQRYVDTTLK